jgi:hypothetical protein
MPMASPNRPVNGGDGIKSFDPRILDRSVIAIPLPEEIRKDEQEIHAVIIDLNLDYLDGRDVPSATFSAASLAHLIQFGLRHGRLFDAAQEK